MLDLSIIVPVYNVEQYIEKLLESFKNVNDKERFEIIFVDDGTKDKSVDIVEQTLGNTSINFTILKQENMGLSAARNHGLKMSKGKYIWFVDSDDVINPLGLSKILDQSLLRHTVDIIQIDVKTFESDVPKMANDDFSYQKINAQELLNDLLTLRRASYSVGFFARREFLTDIHFKFPEGYLFEDIATSYLLFDRACKAGKINGDLYFYRQQMQSITHRIVRKSLTDRLYHINNMLNYFVKKGNYDIVSSPYVQHLLAYVSFDTRHVFQVEDIKSEILELKHRWRIKFDFKYWLIFNAGNSLLLRKVWKGLQAWKKMRCY